MTSFRSEIIMLLKSLKITYFQYQRIIEFQYLDRISKSHETNTENIELFMRLNRHHRIIDDRNI